jgi:hypothetical protein
MNAQNLIVFDCDGVICDFVADFLVWYRQSGFPLTYGDLPDNPPDWDFSWKESNKRKLMKELIAEFIQSKPKIRLFESEIPRIMKQLREEFHYQVIIVTHFPDYDSRLKNLTHLGVHMGIQFDELICVNTTEEKVAKVLEIRPRIYVEDAPHVVKSIHNQITPGPSLTIFIPIRYEYSTKVLSQTMVTMPDVNISMVPYQSITEIIKYLSSV